MLPHSVEGDMDSGPCSQDFFMHFALDNHILKNRDNPESRDCRPGFSFSFDFSKHKATESGCLFFLICVFLLLWPFGSCIHGCTEIQLL